MKIRLEEIFEEPTDANFAAAAEDVNARLSCAIIARAKICTFPAVFRLV
jgi:hypothetical protein